MEIFLNFLFLEQVKAGHLVFLLLLLRTLLFYLPLKVFLVFGLLTLFDLVLINGCRLSGLTTTACPGRDNISELVSHRSARASSAKLAEKVSCTLVRLMHLMNVVPAIRRAVHVP